MSTQDSAYQSELAGRLGLPYEVLSDRDFVLGQSLGLPTFFFNGTRLYRRAVLVAEAGRVAKVFYPVFPPDRSAAEVLGWLSARQNGPGVAPYTGT